MVLEAFTTVQSYIKALISVIASSIWFNLRNEGSFDDSKFIRSLSAVFLITLFFLVRILHFIPLEIKEILQQAIILFTGFSLLIVIRNEFKANKKRRREELKELLQPKKSHPIALEFAREIIKPEIQKLEQTKREFEKEKADTIKKEKTFEARQKKLNEKYATLDPLKKGLEKDRKKLKELENQLLIKQ